MSNSGNLRLPLIYSPHSEQESAMRPTSPKPEPQVIFKKKTLPTVLSVDDLKLLRDFRNRELDKRKLARPTNSNIACISSDQARSLRKLVARDSEMSSNVPARPKSSKVVAPLVLERERGIFEQFVQFSSGTVAFKSSAKVYKVSRFGIESREEKVTNNQGLLSSEGRRGITMDLRECLEFCKKIGIIPVIAGPENDRNLKIYKTDVSSIEYTLIVRTFKEVENEENELDYERFLKFLYRLFTNGLVALEKSLSACIERRENLQLRMIKYLQSTPEPHKKIKEIFSEIFDSVYETFVFFDIEGHWEISAATFMHLCKNVLCIPLTTADLKLTLEEIGWLQTINAHDFIQAFAWHTLEEGRAMSRSESLRITAIEDDLYRAFCFFAQYPVKGMGGTVPSLAEVKAFEKTDSCLHLSFQQYVEFLKFVGVVPTSTIRSITGETLKKTDVGSAEYDVAVKAFRSTVDREDLMEWIEFKDCIFHTIRGGARKLKKDLHRAKNHLYAMRTKLSNFAPSVTNPFQALKLALRTRFDSVFDAFVYFDIDGSWSVSVAEFKSMVKSLGLSLTSNDIDAALKEICALNSSSFTAAEFCSKLNWADSAVKETQRFEVLEHEAELFELFEHFCRGKERHLNRSKSADPIPMGGRGHVMNLSEFLEFAKFTDLIPVEIEGKSGGERVKVNRQSIQYAIAVKVFGSVNWTNEKESEVTWPEFKEIVYQYFKSGPEIAREMLQDTEEELRAKYSQFCDNIVSVADPIVALKNTLRARFNNVFDAFAFMDLNGDWEVSANEMTMAFNDLALGLTRADLFAVIRRIMKRSTVDTALVISPHEFVKVLAWHPRPSQGGIQNALEVAKANRETTAAVALSKAQENPFPKPKPSFQHLRAEDAEEYRRLEANVVELKKIINELEKTFTFRNLQLDLLAMSADDKELRKQNARMRMRERAAQGNEKTMFQLLDESRSRRSAILSEAAKRTRDNRDTPQRYLGEPPPVETLLLYACKRDKDAMLKQVEHNNKLDVTMRKLMSFSTILGVPIRDLPMSTKERFARGEILRKLREERKKALLGQEKIAGQFIEDAKRNRKKILETAHHRANFLKMKWAEAPQSSETVETVFNWVHKKAKAAVLAAFSNRIQLQGHVNLLLDQESDRQEGFHLSRTESGTCSPKAIAPASTSDTEISQQREVTAERSEDISQLQSRKDGSAPHVLSHDIFRFGRKRDFTVLHSLCCEIIKLQMAIAHLNDIKQRGLIGLDVTMLSTTARLEAKLSSSSPGVLFTAAINIQRFCRSQICRNGSKQKKF